MTDKSTLGEHVILVAITVTAPSRYVAETQLHPVLPEPGMRLQRDDVQVESWWIAEDDRRDRSDNEAAVFVPLGVTQEEARQVLRWYATRPAGVNLPSTREDI